MTDDSDREAEMERAVNGIVELIEAELDRQGLSAEERYNVTEAFRLAVERLKRRHE